MIEKEYYEDEEMELSDKIAYLYEEIEQQKFLRAEVYPQKLSFLNEDIAEAIYGLYENGYLDGKTYILLKITLTSSNKIFVNYGFKLLDKIIIKTNGVLYEEKEDLIGLVKELKEKVNEAKEVKRLSSHVFVDDAKTQMKINKLKRKQKKKVKENED